LIATGIIKIIANHLLLQFFINISHLINMSPFQTVNTMCPLSQAIIGIGQYLCREFATSHVQGAHTLDVVSSEYI